MLSDAIKLNLETEMQMEMQAQMASLSAVPAGPAAITTGASAPASELFGSFYLGGDEFALPASCIREVINYPDKVTPLPLSPDYLAGVFTLRGSVIPVISLSRLFGAAACAAPAGQKVAIIDHQQVLVGILFHQTGEILRVRPEQRSILRYAGGERRGGVIAGAILRNDGARLLQILAPDALIHIENLPHILALRPASRNEDGLRVRSQRRQCVSFRAGGAAFAFEMGAIQEIINVPELRASVLHSPLCLGRIDFRGHQVAVVDFAVLLNAHREAVGGAQRIVIARIGQDTIGFLVDAVEHIVSFTSGQLMPIPLLGKVRSGMFGGCVSRPGLGDILLLDHQQIFSQGELVEMRNGHSQLYPDHDAAPQQGRKAQREVHIIFTLEHRFALDIRQVREILDLSDAVTRAPGMPPFMRGMLNLRQQMVCVIDLRSLYRLPPLADGSGGKILIIERGDERYGLLVDGVENILTTLDSQRYSAPKMLRNPSSTDVRSETEQVIDVADADGGHQTVTVFECDALLRRLSQRLAAAGTAS